jgi:hypothetical protein
MKKHILLLALCAFAVSCQDDDKLQYIGQEIIDGKVSATQAGHPGGYGHQMHLPVIWVQTPTVTKEVEIPFSYEGKWKVGDSCLVIIEKYKEIQKK